jgi:hypothetical protein
MAILAHTKHGFIFQNIRCANKCIRPLYTIAGNLKCPPGKECLRGRAVAEEATLMALKLVATG